MAITFSSKEGERLERMKNITYSHSSTCAGGTNRAVNLDWMRVFAMLMVILNHVADYYFSMGSTPSRTVYFYEGISHCAVPLFLLLTGVFVIKKAEDTEPKSFYLHSLKKLGIPFGIFALFYFIYDWNNVGINWRWICRTLINGFSGVYAHWYVVMLAVVYAFIPLVAFMKKRVLYEKYEKTVILISLWLLIGHYFESSQTTWSLSNLYFMSYVLLGDVISTRLKNRKNNFVGLSLIILSLFILAINHSILYYAVLNGGNYYNRLLNLYGAPLIVVSSLLTFTGFSLMKIKRNISIVASVSYTVFLSHKLIMSILLKNTNLFGVIEDFFHMNLKIVILVEWIVLFCISFVFSYVFNVLLKKAIYKKFVKLKK